MKKCFNRVIKVSRKSSLDFMMVSRVYLSVINHCLQVMVSVAFSLKILLRIPFTFDEPGHSLHLLKKQLCIGGLQILIAKQ
jgi:hypothetical protein